MGNQMTAELLAKFNALQLQADTEANKKVKNRNGVVDADNKKEIKIFKNILTKQYNEGKINDKDYLTLMGADFSAKPAPAAEEVAAPAAETPAEIPATPTTPVAETKPEQTRQERRQERKEDKNLQNDIKGDINNYIVNKKLTVTLTNLVERLKNDNGTEAYDEVIEQVDAVVKFVQATNFDSKNEVQALEKKIKNNTEFNDFQKSLAKEMVKLAENAQITKETAKLTQIYESVKAEEGREQNFTAYLETVKTKMNEKSIAGNSYYSDEAFARLEQQVTSEIQTWAHKEMKALKYDTVTAEKKKGIIAEIQNKLPETDKFARKVVAKMGDLAGVESRRINYQRNYDKNLSSISTEDLKKELGNDTYDLLTRNFLDKKDEQGNYIYKNANGTYNLQTIANVIKGAIGADWRMDSYGDEKRSEIQKAIEDLRAKIQRPDFDEANLKKLAKLCKVEYTPRSHSPKDAFGNIVNDTIMGGALAPLGAIKATAVAEAEAGTLAVAGAGTTVSLAPLGALVAAPIVLDALANIIIGVRKDEDTCFKFEEANNRTVKEFAEYLENADLTEEQAQAITVLAKAFEAKYGDKWNTEFIKAMTAAAGNDRVLNCLEFRSAYPTILEGLKPTEEVEEEKPVPPTPVQEKTDAIVTTENVTHTWKPTHSWQAIVLAFYPEAFEGKTYDEIKKMIKPFVDAFRRSQDIGIKQGLPVNQTVEFKPITVNGVTYNPVQATKEDIKKCTSDDWFGYGSQYFTGNWPIPTEGVAKVNGQKRYTSTRTSDGATNSGNDQTATQEALIPGAQENVRTTVTITNVDGTGRKVIVEPKNKAE